MKSLLRAEAIAPQIVYHFGYKDQVTKAIEEMGELTVALCKHQLKPEKSSAANVEEEIADVLIMALQLRHMVGERGVDTMIDLKVSRTIGRIKERGGIVYESLQPPIIGKDE